MGLDTVALRNSTENHGEIPATQQQSISRLSVGNELRHRSESDALVFFWCTHCACTHCTCAHCAGSGSRAVVLGQWRPVLSALRRCREESLRQWGEGLRPRTGLLRIGKAQSPPGCRRMRSCHNHGRSTTRFLTDCPTTSSCAQRDRGHAGAASSTPPAASARPGPWMCAAGRPSATGRSRDGRCATSAPWRSPGTWLRPASARPPSTPGTRASRRLRPTDSSPPGRG